MGRGDHNHAFKEESGAQGRRRRWAGKASLGFPRSLATHQEPTTLQIWQQSRLHTEPAGERCKKGESKPQICRGRAPRPQPTLAAVAPPVRSRTANRATRTDVSRRDAGDSPERAAAQSPKSSAARRSNEGLTATVIGVHTGKPGELLGWRRGGRRRRRGGGG